MNASSAAQRFYCKACGIERWVAHPPVGWLTLAQYHRDRKLKIGLYCTPACLRGAVEELAHRAAWATDEGASADG
jgi:hypothetical protein